MAKPKKSSKPRKPNAKAQENKRIFRKLLEDNPNLSSRQAMTLMRKEMGRSIGRDIANGIYRDVKEKELNPAKVTRMKPKEATPHSKKYLDRWSYLFKYKAVFSDGSTATDTAMYTTMEDISVREAYKRMRERLSGQEMGFEHYNKQFATFKGLKLVAIYFNPDAL